MKIELAKSKVPVISSREVSFAPKLRQRLKLERLRKQAVEAGREAQKISDPDGDGMSFVGAIVFQK